MAETSYVLERDIGQGSSRKNNKSSLLSQLDIELTERCNNNCLHCYINLPAHDHKARKKELSTKILKKILLEAAALGCRRIRFTGGEPLLRHDFEELYVFARRLALRVMLSTNATLITPRLAKLFSRMPPLEKIEVTVYGMKKKSYEAVARAPGSYRAFKRGVGLLLKYKIPFIVKGALLPPNKDEIKAFESWAKTIPWMDKKPPYTMFFDLRKRQDDEKKNDLIRKNRLSAAEGLRLLARNKKEYVEAMKQFCAQCIRPPGKKLFSCGSGEGNGYLDAYGFLQPCVLLNHSDCVYDLKKGTLKEAFERFFPKMRKIKAENADYLKHCAKCFLKGFCEQCPAKAWREFGALDTPVEYLCGIAHVQAEFLGLLGKGEKAWEVADWRARIAQFSNQ